MIYYKEVEKEEHMLFASEIALAFGIYSNSLKPHSTFVKKVCEAKRKELSKEKLFYNTKKGLAQVYDKEIIELVSNDIFKKSVYNVSNDAYAYNIDGKNYMFIRKEMDL